MGISNPNLPVQDDTIETIDDWREEIELFLYRMYGMRFLCEIDPQEGSRFVHIRDAFAGSSSTISSCKDRAEELYLIKSELRNASEGYSTHKYYLLTDVGRHIRAELVRRGIPQLSDQLKPLEFQMKAHRNSVRDNGLSMPVDPLRVFHGEESQ